MKNKYRQSALMCRRGLAPKERAWASALIRGALLSRLERQHLMTAPMLIYKAMGDEVDTRQILTMNRRLLFSPATINHVAMQWRESGRDTEWRRGSFGVEESASERLWNPELGRAVLICPMVGFDRTGNRLGFGKGFFDRWIEQFHEHIITVIGLAFSCQEVPVIRTETHDIPMDAIITERESIECRKY